MRSENQNQNQQQQDSATQAAAAASSAGGGVAPPTRKRDTLFLAGPTSSFSFGFASDHLPVSNLEDREALVDETDVAQEDRHNHDDVDGGLGQEDQQQQLQLQQKGKTSAQNQQQRKIVSLEEITSATKECEGVSGESFFGFGSCTEPSFKSTREQYERHIKSVYNKLRQDVVAAKTSSK